MSRNDIHRMIGIFLLSSISNTMKLVGKINLSTLTKKSSIILLGCLRYMFANCRVTVVGLTSPRPNFLNMDNGIKLILAPKSHNAISKIACPIVHWMVKLPGFLIFGGRFFCIMALHSFVKATVS